MYRPWPILSEKDLVDVSGEEISFRKSDLKNKRHGDFLQFPFQSLPIGQVVTFDELLGECASSLTNFTWLKINQECSKYASEAYALMRIEFFVFYWFEALG